MVDLFNKTMDIPVRTYEVFGFDAFKFKVTNSPTHPPTHPPSSE